MLWLKDSTSATIYFSNISSTLVIHFCITKHCLNEKSSCWLPRQSKIMKAAILTACKTLCDLTNVSVTLIIFLLFLSWVICWYITDQWCNDNSKLAFNLKQCWWPPINPWRQLWHGIYDLKPHKYAEIVWLLALILFKPNFSASLWFYVI